MSEVEPNRWLIQKALRALPVTKYALGLAAIAILASIGRSAWSSIPIVGMLPLIAGVLVLMVLLIIVSRIADGKHTRGPAVIIVWAISLSFIAILLASVSVLLTGWPPNFARLILPASTKSLDDEKDATRTKPSPIPQPPSASSPGTPTAIVPTSTTAANAVLKRPYFVLLVCGVSQRTKEDLRGALNRRGSVISEKDYGDNPDHPNMSGSEVVFYYDEASKKYADDLAAMLTKNFYTDERWQSQSGKGATVKDRPNTYTINMMGAGCLDYE